MATTHANDAIDSFLELEKRFAHFLSAVTFKTEHLKVHSPLLAGLLLEAGSLSESIFKSAMDNGRYNAQPNIAVIRAKRYSTVPPYYNINDSREVFRADQLYHKRVWFLPRSDRSFPWAAWMKAVPTHPKWWRSYNKVKHGRFDHIADAKLGTVMHALGGAFLVLVQTLDYRATLVERGIIRSRNITAAQLRAVASGWEVLQTPESVIARTELFGYKFLSQGSPRQANDVSIFWP